MAADRWWSLAGLVGRGLRDVDPCTGPLLDLCAGTGLSTVAIAEAVARAPIVAVEARRSMRAVLYARVAADRELRDRVTVETDPIARVAFPPRVAAVAGLGVIGFLDPGERCRLWARLGTVLAPGGVVVLDLPPQWHPVVASVACQRVRLGQRTYVGSRSAVREVSGSVCWTTTYRVHTASNGEMLGEPIGQDHITRVRLHPVDAPQLVVETRAAGFSCTGLGQGVFLLRHD
jgi:SAM-dependent methyltransferase